MTSHSSASVREPHVNRISRTNTVINALKRRAQAVLNDKSIDAETRAILRHALETNDPWLAELVRRADAATGQTDSTDEHIEALAEIICGAGNEAAAALFVLMGKLGNSSPQTCSPIRLSTLAFTRCGVLNVFGMVDAQVAVLEGELLANMS